MELVDKRTRKQMGARLLEQNPRLDQNLNREPNQLLERSRPPELNQRLEQNQLRERNHWIIGYKQSSVLLAVMFWCIPKELRSKPSDAQNAETSSKWSRGLFSFSLGF